jgi:phosphoadenosine phosphosulfate reductase
LTAAADLQAAAPSLEDLEPEEVLAWAYRTFDRVAIVASFQAEAVVLIDMACRVVERPEVVTLDTGRLPEETHALMDRVRARYPIDLHVQLPDPLEVGRMVEAHGQNLFRRSVDLRERCCEVRKVRPLARALEGFDAWVTGLRRDQSASRRRTPVVQVDRAHGGMAKIAPLAGWTRDRVWAYTEEHDLERHELYARGYLSIGCAPCTRAVGPGEDERAGRWWWETSTTKECGLHVTADGRLVRADGGTE